jgi:hypothetical protein
MDRRELFWRGRASARIAIDRAGFLVRAPRWDRRRLVHILGADPALRAARQAARASDWIGAHQALDRHFAARPARFLIAPELKSAVAASIRADFPGSARVAALRGDCIVAGEYDLLGYRRLRFDGWQHDPVHGRHAPPDFWARVRYLDPGCGDHKIIWELNRHQHFLALGRAFWLTGDRTYRTRFVAELRSWLDGNPPLTGINWASMLELAFRSMSWLWALNFFAGDGTGDEEPWIVDLLIGLDRQLAHVERNLSYYFSPNTHLLGEALALYVCGRALPELRASARWTTVGRRILIDEVDRQIGADGMHRERSTHYHRYALDFYLLALAVARITDDQGERAFEKAANRLASAARLLADERGRLPHIGDDDGGRLAPLGERRVDDLRDSLAVASAMLDRGDLAVGPPPEEASWWLAHPAVRTSRAGRLPEVRSCLWSSAAMADSGYYVSRSQRGDHLVVDGGPHGYLNGGHAHADSLALTFGVGGVPLLVDCGTADYTTDPELRDRMRSSAMHNTVVVDGRSQSAPSGPFHWAHVASGAVRRWRANDGFDYFDGSHDGYLPLVHRRRVLNLHGDLLVVADFLDGSGVHSAAVHWHLAPAWSAAADASRAVLTREGERVDFVAPIGVLEAFNADAATGLGWHSPVYGRVEPTISLRLTHTASAPFWIVSVFGLDVANAVRGVDLVPVWAEAGALSSSIGLRILRESSTDCVVVADPSAETSIGTWRMAELETDACLLFCRLVEGQATRVAIVDGSRARTSQRQGFELALPQTVSDLHLDLSAGARIAGPTAGARLVVGGRELSISTERRGTARTRSGSRAS